MSLALTERQGDAFVTGDAALAREVAGNVSLAPIEDLIVSDEQGARGA